MISTIMIIGCGGTGSYLAVPIARLIKSMKLPIELILVDGDSYSVSNVDRQSFQTTDLNKNKALAQAETISNALEEMEVSIIDTFLSKDDVDEVVNNGCLVINCADNNAIRKYVEDRIDTLDNAVHICCGNDMHHGQVQVSAKEEGVRTCRSIYEYAPVFADGSGDRSKMDCQQLAALPSGGQIISANLMAASLALNYVTSILTKHTTKLLQTDTVAYDTLSNCFNVNRRPAESITEAILERHKRKPKVKAKELQIAS